MKKIFISLVLCLFTLSAFSQAKGDTKYLAGAVPVENGFVNFKHTYTVEGKSRAELFTLLKDYTQSQIIENENSLPQTRITELSENEGIIAASIEETLYFTRKAWVSHSTRFFYQLVYYIEDGKFTIEMRRLRYIYADGTATGAAPETIKAEDWITDKEALNKTQTKLTRIAGKFRRATIDRKDEIFRGAARATGAIKKRVQVVESEE